MQDYPVFAAIRQLSSPAIRKWNRSYSTDSESRATIEAVRLSPRRSGEAMALPSVSFTALCANLTNFRSPSPSTSRSIPRSSTRLCLSISAVEERCFVRNTRESATCNISSHTLHLNNHHILLQRVDSTLDKTNMN